MMKNLTLWNAWIGDPSFEHDPFIRQKRIDSGEDHPLWIAIGDRSTGGEDDGCLEFVMGERVGKFQAGNKA